MSTVTVDVASHVAHLANLPLSQSEVAAFAPQLDGVLEYTKQAQSLKTDGVEETSQVTGLENVTRDDVVTPDRMLTQEQALSNAHRVQNGYFVVPGLLSE